MRSVRYAFRSLVRTPGFSCSAVLILTLAVGGAATVFSMLYALVLRPLPVPAPHELVQVSVYNHNNQAGDMTWRQYQQLAARQTVFKTIITSLQQGAMAVEIDGAMQMSSIAGVSGNYFSELGASRPALGRLIEPRDLHDGSVTGEPVVVLSWEYWQRHFGGAANVVGRGLKIEGTPVTVIGVAPRRFLGLSVSIDHDLTVPVTLMPALLNSEASMVAGTSSWLATTGRLRDGVTVGEARAQIETLWPNILSDAAPVTFQTTQRADYFKRRVSVESGANGWERGLRSRYLQPLYVLLGIAVLVLLIAGANLCSLIVARVEARRHELGVRLAIGAGRWTVIRELGVEAVLLGIAGSTMGLLASIVASREITTFILKEYAVNAFLDVTPDATLIAIAFAAGIGVTLIAMLVSAVAVTRGTTAGLTPGGARTVARSWGLGRAMIGVQVALSIVLLSQASLLVRSVYSITSVSSGLTHESVLLAYPSPRVDGYRNLDASLYYPRALERVRAIPGVEAAAFSSDRPEGGMLPTTPVGRAATPLADGDWVAETPMVSPGFFQTLGIQLLRGRDFTFSDTEKTRKVAIISERVERQLFGPGEGLGARMRISHRDEWQDVEVIGIVSDARVFDIRRANTAIVYTAAIQSGELAHWKTLIVRGPESATSAIAAAIDGLGAEYVRRTRTLEYARGRAILQERLMASLGSAFGAIALVLVAAGFYGLLSYVLSLRRKEFGIRLALGAEPRNVATQLAGTIALTTAIGVCTGLVLTLIATPVLKSVLVQTSVYDPIAIGGAVAVLFVIGMLAVAGPARRASRVEPLNELRQD